MTRTADARARIEEAITGLRAWTDAVRERVVVVDVAVAALKRFQEADGSVLAGYLAYRLFLLVFPMVAIVVALAGFSPSTTNEAADHMRLGATIANSITQASSDTQHSRLPLLISGLFAFVLAAWGLLGGLQLGAARVWRIPIAKFPAKGRAFLRLCGSLLVFGFVLYLSAVIRRVGVLAGLAGSLTTLASTTVAFYGLAWMLPHRCREWFWLLPGAGVGAAGAVGMQAFATFYLPGKLAGASETYGALGTTLVFLSYLFLLGVLFVASQVVNAVVYERYRDDPPGLLRRIAQVVPFNPASAGMGYVPEGGVAEAPQIFRGIDGP